ncbi:MAG: hypothetical protein Q4D53_07535, partial [Leptotrichiaceae bacterium]|nr:hypothetical protein [Leptotrichiaceae bacterium]
NIITFFNNYTFLYSKNYESVIEVFEFIITKDKVYFEYFWDDDDWKEFLKISRDINSYLELEMNEI